MNFQILSAYASPLALVVKLALENASANRAENEARDNRKGGLVDAIRAYATVTHADGVPHADANDALRIALQSTTDGDGKPVIPAGTVKNYTAAARGFRVMLDRGEAIADKSTKDATDAIRSDEQVRVDAAKAEFRKLTKKYTAAQWEELVALVTPAAPVVADESADESDESEATPAEAQAA